MTKLFFLILIALLSDCSRTETQAVYRKIYPAQAYQMMLENEGCIILDVRTNEEFRERRIDGAILIPDYEIRERAGQELSDKDIVILVYCRSGGRSERAARTLVSMGYTNVYDFGGINVWPYKTVSD